MTRLHPRTLLLSCLAAMSAGLFAQEDTGLDTIALHNPGFEAGFDGWTLRNAREASGVLPEAAFSGERGVRIVSGEGTQGTSLASLFLPVDTTRAYRLAFQARLLAGSGAFVSLRFYDAAGVQINSGEYNSPLSIQAGNQWKRWEVNALPPAEATQVGVWIWLRSGPTPVKAEFDDFELFSRPIESTPPWEPRYKIRADQPERLTEADVVGPDGFVYPSWQHAGIAGGIPENLPVVVAPSEFLAVGDADFSPLLTAAIRQAAEAGGGVVGLPEGTFYLDSPVFVDRNGVVIRGAGSDATRLVFRGAVPYGKLRLVNWGGVERFGPGATLEIWANPKDLVMLEARREGTVLRSERRRDHWGNRFSLPLSVADLIKRFGPGEHTIHATARYANGDVFEQDFHVTLTDEPVQAPAYGQLGILNFSGGGYRGSRQVPLVEDGVRGSRQLKLEPDHGFVTGDRLEIEAPATERWNRLTGNQAPWGTFRFNQYRVVGVAGDRVEIDRPLRIDFPVEDASNVRKIHVVSRSGVEGLTVEQPVITTDLSGTKIRETLWYPIEDLWLNGVFMHFAWECWARDVRVLNAGRNPFYSRSARSCEVRDSEFDGAIFKGGGGSGYLGFERSADCLMEKVVTRRLRHAPNVQWGSSGNVIRASRFEGSDGQWHAGWTHENLFEGNVLVSSPQDLEANGNYGYGFYASGPAVPTHGPQGPRNVVYGNDVTCPRTGLFMRGGNEAWLILHNRFRIEEGRAVQGGEKGFDHIIANNVFVIRAPREPVIYFTSPDAVGMEIVGNRFHGPVRTIVGYAGSFGKLERVADNTIAPYEADAPMPVANPASIYLWQKANPPVRD